MNSKYDNIIAIDPDVEKSGVAFLEVKTRKLELSALSFPLLMDYLQFAKKTASESGQTFAVIVEAGYLNKPNFHLPPNSTPRMAAQIGCRVGRNQETAAKIIESCRHWNIEVKEAKPLPKCWAGKDRKITHDELAAFTGIMVRTNQDQRDAALLAWIYADLPIRIPPKK